ncbi:protein of unknown function [Streptomyces sp. KY70]|nr:protein of unknown function [Streptomyces sp. KY70]
MTTTANTTGSTTTDTPATITTVYVPAPDGTPLATDLCLPATPGPHPAVVIRTPYGRTAHRAELRGWAAHGFAALAQDVRGRHGSPGPWHPYRDHEESDGAATVAWVRGQAWSGGGPVVAVGSSYAAHCALVTALGPPGDGLPDAVIAAVPALGLADTAREPAGPERLWARAGWWAAHGDRPDSPPDALAHALADDPGCWNTSRSPGCPTAWAGPCPPGPASGTTARAAGSSGAAPPPASRSSPSAAPTTRSPRTPWRCGAAGAAPPACCSAPGATASPLTGPRSRPTVSTSVRCTYGGPAPPSPGGWSRISAGSSPWTAAAVGTAWGGKPAKQLAPPPGPSAPAPASGCCTEPSSPPTRPAPSAPTTWPSRPTPHPPTAASSSPPAPAPPARPGRARHRPAPRHRRHPRRRLGRTRHRARPGRPGGAARVRHRPAHRPAR